MSTLKVLKEYLVGDGGYLLNPDNNSKTVMLSGAWGSGKTHFWLEDIKPQLVDKKQKNIYISLYGKESIGELKFEVLREAYNLEVKEDFISKTASMISSIAPSLGEKSLVDGFDKLNKKAKEKKAEEILKSGSIICLDDFERKSKKIDLNDLFGYISQLALDYHCKVVIILNSDVFEGEEANVFKTVKEKTVNKFFYFEPTIEELFNSIYESNEKYKKLDDYKEEILKAIEKTEELNARIYIQVLDNCLEWIEKERASHALRVLALNTICFIKNHFVLSYPKMIEKPNPGFLVGTSIHHNGYEEEHYSGKIKKMIASCGTGKEFTYNHCDDAIDAFKSDICVSHDNQLSETLQTNLIDEINSYYDEIKAIIKFGYKLYVAKDVKKDLYLEVSNFIKSGILLPNKEIPS